MNLKGIYARELALDLLHRSDCKVQVAAVLSDNYSIFAYGWNSGPRNHNHVKGVHAEAHAFSRANPKRLKGATLTVAARRKRSKSQILARPCEKCTPLIKKHHIKIIEYTTPNNTWAVEIWD